MAALTIPGMALTATKRVLHVALPRRPSPVRRVRRLEWAVAAGVRSAHGARPIASAASDRGPGAGAAAARTRHRSQPLVRPRDALLADVAAVHARQGQRRRYGERLLLRRQ